MGAGWDVDGRFCSDRQLRWRKVVIDCKSRTSLRPHCSRRRKLAILRSDSCGFDTVIGFWRGSRSS